MPGLLRSAEPIITYAGQNVTPSWAPKLKHLVWKKSVGNSTEKNADSITISMSDEDGYLRQNFDLKAKQPLKLQIESRNWNYPGEVLLSEVTEMEISRVEIEGTKDSGTLVVLTASSIPPTCGFRLTKKSRSAVQTTVKDIATQVAKDQGWSLQYTTSVNPTVKYAEQHDQSDAAFLQRFCIEHDLYFRVRNKVLIIGSMQELEKQKPKGTIVCPRAGVPGGINGRGIISWRLVEDVEDTYANSLLQNKDVKTGEVSTGFAEDEDKNGPTHNNVHKPLAVTGPTEPSEKTDKPEGE
jgi:Phage tail baseplate hub (GPD)